MSSKIDSSSKTMERIKLDKRSHNMIDGKVKKYRQTYVYIIDDATSDGTNARKRKRATDHEFNCDLFRGFFGQYTDCKVVKMVFGPIAKKKDFVAAWEAELADKTSDDLLIIYFHGAAAEEDKKWSWKLDCIGGKWLNAYEFINMVNKGQADAMFILHCYIQTRFTNRWQRKNGSTEIIARPECMPISTRQAKDVMDFTEGMISNLEAYVERIDGQFKNSRALRSIPQILASDNALFSNPIRIWLEKPNTDNESVIRRFKVDPILIRKTGKLEIFADLIQGSEVSKFT